MLHSQPWLWSNSLPKKSSEMLGFIYLPRFPRPLSSILLHLGYTLRPLAGSVITSILIFFGHKHSICLAQGKAYRVYNALHFDQANVNMFWNTLFNDAAALFTSLQKFPNYFQRPFANFVFKRVTIWMKFGTNSMEKLSWPEMDIKYFWLAVSLGLTVLHIRAVKVQTGRF